MKQASLAVAAVVLAAFLAVPAQAAKNSNSIQIKGSDTIVNLIQALAEEYMAKKPEAFLAVTGGGSGTGFAALINGTCDVAMASREIKDAERKLAEQRGIEPREWKIALDGLAVIVHPKNPVSSLTLDQLGEIFTGKITNWKDVGGPDLRIVVLSREVNSGTHVYFKEHVLRHNDTGSKEEFSPEALLMPSSQAIAEETANNTGAIGYFGMGYLNDTLKALSVAKDATQAPVRPTLNDVISGAYPISRPLLVYTKKEPSAEVTAFMDFILSPEGQTIVSQNDFVPIQKA